VRFPVTETPESRAVGDHGDAGRRRLSRPAAQRDVGPDRGVLEMLASVLSGLTFPARPWQIIAAAESYGADARTMTRLHQLPAMSYPSLQHVAHAYSRGPGAPRGGQSASRSPLRPRRNPGPPAPP